MAHKKKIAAAEKDRSDRIEEAKKIIEKKLRQDEENRKLEEEQARKKKAEETRKMQIDEVNRSKEIEIENLKRMEEDEDVNCVYHNLEMTDELIEAIELEG